MSSNDTIAQSPKCWVMYVSKGAYQQFKFNITYLDGYNEILYFVAKKNWCDFQI